MKKFKKTLATLMAVVCTASALCVPMNISASEITPDNSFSSYVDRGYTMSVPLMYQSDDKWGDTYIGLDSNGNRAYIRNQGCAITCFAMILKYYGLEKATPLKVYEDMTTAAFPSFDFYGAANTYYSSYVSLNDGKTSYNPNDDKCDNISYENNVLQQANARGRLYTAIRSGKPVIVGVAVNGHSVADHFVVATGVSPGNAVTYINDPKGVNSSYTTLNQYISNNYFIQRIIIYS